MAFCDEVYRLVSMIPFGRVTTYKEIAVALGSKAYRAVGAALRKNSNLESIPCFKVVCSDGRLGGYVLGRAEKIKRLASEGIFVKGCRIEYFNAKLHSFSDSKL